MALTEKRLKKMKNALKEPLLLFWLKRGIFLWCLPATFIILAINYSGKFNPIILYSGNFSYDFKLLFLITFIMSFPYAFVLHFAYLRQTKK